MLAADQSARHGGNTIGTHPQGIETLAGG